MSAPTEEDFLAWQQDHVTQWVMQALLHEAQGKERAFIEAAWVAGRVDKTERDAWRAQYEACANIRNRSYQEWASMNEDSGDV